MAQFIDEKRTEALACQSGLKNGPSPLDVVALLSAGSAGAWDVEPEVDPSGDVSIVVLPACDDPAMPTFLLYQKDGAARVATIRHEIWEDDRAFPGCRQAAAAIIELTSALSIAA
jgi:hypothetical protein